MKFVWGNCSANAVNLTLAFCLHKKCKQDAVLLLYAANAYRVFADGKLVSYGPERTAAGHSRARRITVSNACSLVVEVAGYNITCYNNAFEQPFFAAQLFSGGGIAALTDDFDCKVVSDRLQRVQRLSYQRNFVEYYVQHFDKSMFYMGDFSLYPAIDKIEVNKPICIEGNDDNATYAKIELAAIYNGSAFKDCNAECPPKYIWWENFVDEGKMDGYKQSELEADLVAEVSHLDCAKEGNLQYCIFGADKARTGLITLNVKVMCESTIYAIFDEVASENDNGTLEVDFSRPVFHNAVAWRLAKGQYSLITFEPYEFKYLKIVVDGNATIEGAGLIEIANGQASACLQCDNSKVLAVFDAGRNSFCQNAVDIFMDCPGRERAGWLCDSFFTARAEQLLTGKNTIEQHFLENFILTREQNQPFGMIPMCYPACQRDGTFIPNWAMWYVVELQEYFYRTGDAQLIKKAQTRVYQLISYFNDFLNSDGLLENLKGWIFLEWSIANDDRYTCGVNYPSNMLYARMLCAAATLYNDNALLNRCNTIKQRITQQSFNGEFFVDNAVRNASGQLVATGNISETCQYYALFCGIDCNGAFKSRMINQFGLNRKAGKHDTVGKSNAFIGNYLRLLWLLEIGEYETALNECIDFFYYMAQRTGTLWEYQSTEASCNHGFTSVVCTFVAQLLFGYCGFSQCSNQISFSKNFASNINAKITLPIGAKSLVIKVENGERTITHTTTYKIKIL